MTMSENNSNLHIEIDKGSVDDCHRILQITDCHLGGNIGEKLVGMDTDNSLDLIISNIKQRQDDASLLLVTGDLANHAKAEAYLRLRKKLDALQIDQAWLSGNHDSHSLMVDTVGHSLLPRSIRLGRWLIIMLDSSVPGKVAGHLGTKELEGLSSTLKKFPDEQYVLVCLHHQPVRIGCDWLDEQRVSDSEEFIDILSKESRLKGIIWGHVHQEFSGTSDRLPGVKLLSTPSTCIQFSPKSKDFKLDNLLPGYRWLDLYIDGNLETGISRLEGVELSVDYASKGY